MSPCFVVGIVAYWAVAFWLASRLGSWLARTDEPGPRVVVVESRERVGEVRFLPARGDAQNARTQAER